MTTAQFLLRVMGKWKCRIISLPIEYEKPLGMILNADNTEKFRFTMRYPHSLAQLPSTLVPRHPAGLHDRFQVRANFRNVSMKLSGNISKICLFRNICIKEN